jgi:ParB family chromosome partitioning protein
MNLHAMKVSKLKIGSRFRREVGDIRSLASSIETIGLLHPIVVDERGHVVAGARPLAGVKALHTAARCALAELRHS